MAQKSDIRTGPRLTTKQLADIVTSAENAGL